VLSQQTLGHASIVVFLLIPQAKAANLTFITADKLTPQYGIQCLQP
jgi:hypothetical protein